MNGTGVRVRPATAADAAAHDAGATPWAESGVLADRWRTEGNRRSLVAVEGDGGHEVLIGHCRGINNVFHPDSRVCVLEVRPDRRRRGIGRALLEAQRAVSDVPLHLKVGSGDAALRGLALAAGGTAIQAMPPWRRVVGPELRAWARERTGAVRAQMITSADRTAVAALEADHYIAQHATWSPAAGWDTLLEEMAEGHQADSPSAYDPRRSVVVRREGVVTAAALVRPEENHHGQRGCEVTLLARPYDGAHARADKEACLAAVVERSADRDVLMIDSHLTERVESAMMSEVPGLDDDSGWMAIIAVTPTPGRLRPGAEPIGLDPRLLPADARWIAAHCPS